MEMFHARHAFWGIDMSVIIMHVFLRCEYYGFYRTQVKWIVDHRVKLENVWVA